MSAYTQDLINILYTGIYHSFDDIYDFLNFIEINMDYDFSKGVTFQAEDNFFMYYKDGETFFVVEVDEDKISFIPGDAFETISEEPELVKEALLSFLIYFKNYDTLESIEEIDEDFKKSRGSSGKKSNSTAKKPKRVRLATKKESVKFISDSEEEEYIEPEEEEESEEPSSVDEWV